MKNGKRKMEIITTASSSNLSLVWRWIALAVVLLVLIFVIFKPLRIFSKRFVIKGDQYLLEQKYVSADLEYDKALMLDPDNKIIKQRKNLVRDGSSNIIYLIDFYKENNDEKALSFFESANAFPKNETEALKLSKQLMKDGQYQMAIIPAKTATEMDPDYGDAWLYLSIANLKVSQMLELLPAVKNQYLDQAKEAFNKAKELNPENENVMSLEKTLGEI